VIELQCVAAGLEDEAPSRGGQRASMARICSAFHIDHPRPDKERGDTAADRILDIPLKPGRARRRSAAEGDVDMGVIFGELRP
jgi:hypothetical protein